MTPQAIRELTPRQHMKLMRNHFADNPYEAVSVDVSALSDSRVVCIQSKLRRLTRRLWAAERSHAYRFNAVNAVFNPRKVLLGDDPDCLAENGSIRSWLDNE